MKKEIVESIKGARQIRALFKSTPSDVAGIPVSQGPAAPVVASVVPGGPGSGAPVVASGAPFAASGAQGAASGAPFAAPVADPGRFLNNFIRFR